MHPNTETNWHAIPIRSLNELAAIHHDSLMNRTAANLKLLMKHSGIGENELARQTKVPQPTIHRVAASRSADPRDGTLRPIAKFFGVTVEDLRTMSAEEAEKVGRRKAGVEIREPIAAYDVRAVEGPNDYDPTREAMVEEVEVEVSGGPGAWNPEYVETKFRMPFQLYWFREKRTKPENVKLLRVKGSSMERTLFDGDRVAVDLANRRIAEDHVFAIWYGGAKVKRLFQKPDGTLRIVSDNTDKERYPDEFVPPDELDQVYIIGRVIDKGGSGGL